MNWWRRLFASSAELDAEAMIQQVEDAGATIIDDVTPGTITSLTGVLHSVVYRADKDYPVLDGELFDGSGTVVLRWLGRRRIQGLNPGVRLAVTGRLVRLDGRITMFNPTYTLLPNGGHE